MLVKNALKPIFSLSVCIVQDCTTQRTYINTFSPEHSSLTTCTENSIKQSSKRTPWAKKVKLQRLVLFSILMAFQMGPPQEGIRLGRAQRTAKEHASPIYLPKKHMLLLPGHRDDKHTVLWIRETDLANRFPLQHTGTLLDPETCTKVSSTNPTASTSGRCLRDSQWTCSPIGKKASMRVKTAASHGNIARTCVVPYI